MNFTKTSISHLQLTKSFTERLLLFQSARQFHSYLLSCLIAIIIVMLLAYQLMPADFLDQQLLIIVSLCVAGSALIVVAGALNSEFRISSTDRLADARVFIDRELQRLGYHQRTPEAGNRTIYTTTGPAWSRWTENRVIVERSPSGLTVNGPVFSLRILRSRLIRSLDEETVRY